MNFPSELDFLESFGIEPISVDPSTAFCRYTKKSPDGCSEVDFSFSAVAESFQVAFRCSGEEVACLSAEGVSLIEFDKTPKGSGVRVKFDVNGLRSEAEITLEPIVHCSWWSIRY